MLAKESESARLWAVQNEEGIELDDRNIFCIPWKEENTYRAKRASFGWNLLSVAETRSLRKPDRLWEWLR
jgi:hypothetical protein